MNRAVIVVPVISPITGETPTRIAPADPVKPELGQGVDREGHVPGHDEAADDPGHDRDHDPGRDRVLDEGVAEQVDQLVHQGPGAADRALGGRPSCRRGSRAGGAAPRARSRSRSTRSRPGSGRGPACTSTCEPYRSDIRSEVRTSSGVPAAQRPLTTNRTRSTRLRIGLTSWVTNRTVRPVRRLPAADQVGDLLLVVQVQAGQRLVAQEQARIADDRLGDPQALLLAARQPPDRRVGVGRRLDRLDHLVHPPTIGARRPADAPAVAVDPQLDQVAAAQRQVLVERLVLGHVADARIAPPGRPPSTSTDPPDSGVRPRITRRSDVLPEPFGPRIATNEGSSKLERQVAPDPPIVVVEGRLRRSGRRAACRHRASATGSQRLLAAAFSWPSCQLT